MRIKYTVKKIDKKTGKIKTYDIDKALNELEDHRSIILVGHLYLEFAMDEFIKQYFIGRKTPESTLALVNQRQFDEFILYPLTFREKTKALEKIGLIDDRLRKGLDKYNRKRNKIAHDLDYKLTKKDCEIQRSKCIKFYGELSGERHAHLENMKKYEVKEIPEKKEK